MFASFDKAERVMLYAFLMDLLMAFPIIGLGFLSGSAAAGSEAARAILLWAIDIFSFGMLLAVNRHRFSQFEFGIEKVQILVQVVIAIGMCASVVFIGGRVVESLTQDSAPPDYLLCVVFAVFSYINVMVNFVALRRLKAEEKEKPSIILRGQIKNRSIMELSSVVATISAAAVVIPDPEVFAYIDSIGALIVLCVIVYTMVQMMRSSVMTLLDAPIEEGEKLLVFREIAERFDQWSSIAFVRTRRLGYSKYVEIGLCFDEAVPLAEALATCRDIEAGIRGRVDKVFVTVFPASEPTAEEPVGFAPSS